MHTLTNDVIPAVLYASTHPHGQLKEPLPSPSETHLNQMLLLPPTETHHPDAVSIGDELTPLEEDDRVVLSADQEQYYQELKQYLTRKDWDLDEMLRVVDSEFCSALDKPYHQDGNLFPLCEELRTLNNLAKKAFFVEVGSGEDQKFLVKNGLLPPYLILEGKIRYLKEGDFDFGNKALFLMGNGPFKSYSDDGISNRYAGVLITDPFFVTCLQAGAGGGKATKDNCCFVNYQGTIRGKATSTCFIKNTFARPGVLFWRNDCAHVCIT